MVLLFSVTVPLNIKTDEITMQFLCGLGSISHSEDHWQVKLSVPNLQPLTINSYSPFPFCCNPVTHVRTRVHVHTYRDFVFISSKRHERFHCHPPAPKVCTAYHPSIRSADNSLTRRSCFANAPKTKPAPRAKGVAGVVSSSHWRPRNTWAFAAGPDLLVVQ